MANTVEIEGLGKFEIEGFDGMSPAEQAKAVDEIAAMHNTKGAGPVGDWAGSRLADVAGGVIGAPRAVVEGIQGAENLNQRLMKFLGIEPTLRTSPTGLVKPSAPGVNPETLPSSADVAAQARRTLGVKEQGTPGWIGRNIVDPAIAAGLPSAISGPAALIGAGAGIGANALPQAPGITGDPDLEKVAGLVGAGLGALGGKGVTRLPEAVSAANRGIKSVSDKAVGTKVLDEEAAAQLSGRIEKRAGEMAEQLGTTPEKIINTVNPKKSASADQLFQSVWGDLNAEINRIRERILKDKLDPKLATTFEEAMDRISGSKAANVNKRIQQVASASDISMLDQLVGGWQEGRQLVNLIKQQNELSNLRRQGLTGGFSQYTDLISPFGKSRANLAIAGLGAHLAAGPIGPAAVAAVPLAGRAIDALTGQRSRIASLTRQYPGSTALPETSPALPSYLETKLASNALMRLQKETATLQRKAENFRIQGDKQAAIQAEKQLKTAQKAEAAAQAEMDRQGQLASQLDMQNLKAQGVETRAATALARREGYFRTQEAKQAAMREAASEAERKLLDSLPVQSLRTQLVEGRAANALMKREAAARQASEIPPEGGEAVVPAPVKEITARQAKAQQAKAKLAEETARVAEEQRAGISMRMQEMKENRLPANPGEGYNRLIYDETGLRPQQATKGVVELLKEGEITKKDYNLFFTDPTALQPRARGALILNKLRKMAEEGSLERDPNWVPVKGQYPAGKIEGKQASYGVQVEASSNLARLMADNAPHPDIAIAANEIAATKGRVNKRAILQDLLAAYPQFKDYINRFKALTEFGPEDVK